VENAVKLRLKKSDVYIQETLKKIPQYCKCLSLHRTV